MEFVNGIICGLGYKWLYFSHKCNARIFEKMEIDKNIILKLIKALEDLNKTLSDKNLK